MVSREEDLEIHATYPYVDKGIEEIRFSVTGTKLFLKLRIVLWGGPGLRKRLPVTGAELFLKLRIVLFGGGEDRARRRTRLRAWLSVTGAKPTQVP